MKKDIFQFLYATEPTVSKLKSSAYNLQQITKKHWDHMFLGMDKAKGEDKGVLIHEGNSGPVEFQVPPKSPGGKITVKIGPLVKGSEDFKEIPLVKNPIPEEKKKKKVSFASKEDDLPPMVKVKANLDGLKAALNNPDTLKEITALLGQLNDGLPKSTMTKKIEAAIIEQDEKEVQKMLMKGPPSTMVNGIGFASAKAMLEIEDGAGKTNTALNKFLEKHVSKSMKTKVSKAPNPMPRPRSSKPRGCGRARTEW